MVASLPVSLTVQVVEPWCRWSRRARPGRRRRTGVVSWPTSRASAIPSSLAETPFPGDRNLRQTDGLATRSG